MASDELERQLRALADPRGGGPHDRRRERAAQYLLEHAAEAHPRLMEALRAKPTALDAPVIIQILPRFGRPESVPLLHEILLRNLEVPSRAAGEALGRHPDPAARAALLRALESAGRETLIGALDGFLLRGDASMGGALKPMLAHRDPGVRYRAMRTAAALGVLSREQILSLEQSDPDPDIRALARELAARQP
jgi:HEAT repeat protein